MYEIIAKVIYMFKNQSVLQQPKYKFFIYNATRFGIVGKVVFSSLDMEAVDGTTDITSGNF